MTERLSDRDRSPSLPVHRYGRLQAVNAPRPWLYLASRIGYAFFGIFELIFLVGLSAVGEKEHGVYHVMLFYTFGIFAFLFFTTNTICHSQSLYYLAPYVGSCPINHYGS